MTKNTLFTFNLPWIKEKIRITNPYDPDEKWELIIQNSYKQSKFAKKFNELYKHWITWYWKTDDWFAVMLVIDTTKDDQVASSLFTKAIDTGSFYKAKLYKWKVYLLYLGNNVNTFKRLILSF